MAGRINVDTMIELVKEELLASLQRLTTDQPQPHLPPPTFWQDATPIPDGRRGHLQELDERGLADWATEHKSSIRLLARPGDYVFPGALIALMKPPVEGADVAVNFTTALGPQRTSSSDLRFAVRQLVEVAV